MTPRIMSEEQDARKICGRMRSKARLIFRAPMFAAIGAWLTLHLKNFGTQKLMSSTLSDGAIFANSSANIAEVMFGVSKNPMALCLLGSLTQKIAAPSAKALIC